jgi:hypothetical protein
MTRNRPIVRGAIVAGAVLAVYMGGWFIVAQMLKSGFEAWVADRRSDGWVVGHGPVTLNGFPFSWRAVIESPRLAGVGPDGIYRWSGPAITLNWKPWRPRTVHYTTGGAHVFDGGPDAPAVLPRTILEMASGQGRLVFGSHGRLSRLVILLDGASLSLPESGSLLFNRLRASIITNPPPNGTGPGTSLPAPSFSLDSEIFGLTFPAERRPPLGRTIGRIALRGTVLGAIPPGRPSVSLATWQKQGGAVKIGDLAMGWGPLNMTGSGTVALDPALQPVAALNGKFTGFDETLQLLVAAGLIKPNIGRIASFALGAMARPSGSGGQPQITVPVTVQDGLLTVGPLQLLRLPNIRWR